MLSANAIVNLQDQWTRAWHQAQPQDVQGQDLLDAPTSLSGTEADWLNHVTRQHSANFDLWHIEDEARTPGASDSDLASVKRRIDQANQRRNDLVEELDQWLLQWLAPLELPEPSAPLQSESPGLIIDRLSILSLKIYHTREETDRPGAPAGHTQRNLGRLAILEEQRADLAQCLDVLWSETMARTRRFKLYRQLKMYNDPSLNPAIYTKKAIN
jgi:hypothetical protein